MAIRTDFGASLYGAFDPTDLVTWAGTPFIMTEATGLYRTVALFGPALPHAPYSLPMERTGRTTRYPGQTKATQHVIGYSEGETSIEGRWTSQDLAGDIGSAMRSLAGVLPGIPILSAEDLREAVYDLVRGGQEIIVTWAGVERRTSILSFDPQHITRGEIRWSMRFEWAGAAKFMALPIVDSLLETASNAFDMISAALDWAKYPANLALDLIDFVGDQVGRIEALVADLRDTIGLYTTAASRAFEVAQRAIGIVDAINAAAKAVRDQVSALVAEVAGEGVVAGSPIATAETAAIAAWLRATGRGAAKVQAQAGRLGYVLREVSDPRIEAVLVVQGDTDLRMVAQQRWGDPDGWRRIAAHNGLTSSSVAGGTTLTIPSRAAA